jgi:drug/metabolite transporter (DMT)-like permease
LFLFFVLFYKGELSKLKVGRSVFIILLLGLFSLINNILYYFAFLKTTIANAVFTHYTAPIFVALLAPILIKERIESKTWITIPIASLGLFLIFFNSDLTLRAEPQANIGLLAGTASGLAYALIIIIARRISASYSPYVIAIISNGTIVTLIFPFAVIVDYNLTPISILLLLVMGLVHSTIAIVIYLEGLKEVKAQEAAILGYLEPVGAILLALAIFGETPSGIAVIGGILILLAGYLVTVKKVL